MTRRYTGGAVRGFVSTGRPAGRSTDPGPPPEPMFPEQIPYPQQQAPQMQPYDVPGAASPGVAGLSGIIGGIGAGLADQPGLLNMVMSQIQGQREEQQRALQANVGLRNQQRLQQAQYDQQAATGQYGADVSAAGTKADLTNQYNQARWEHETARANLAAEGDMDQFDAGAFTARMEGLMYTGPNSMMNALYSGDPAAAQRPLQFIDPLTKEPVQLHPEVVHGYVRSLVDAARPENKAAAEAVYEKWLPKYNEFLEMGDFAPFPRVAGEEEPPPPPPAEGGGMLGALSGAASAVGGAASAVGGALTAGGAGTGMTPQQALAGRAAVAAAPVVKSVAGAVGGAVETAFKESVGFITSLFGKTDLTPLYSELSKQLGDEEAQAVMEELEGTGLGKAVNEGTAEAYRKYLMDNKITSFSLRKALYKVIVSGNVKNKAAGSAGGSSPSRGSVPVAKAKPAAPAPQKKGMTGLSESEAWIIRHESSGRVTAKNPESSAFGLGQLIKANREKYAAELGITNPDTTDYNEQLAMFRAYVKDRYGTAEKAQEFWEEKGWY